MCCRPWCRSHDHKQASRSLGAAHPDRLHPGQALQVAALTAHGPAGVQVPQHSRASACRATRPNPRPYSVRPSSVPRAPCPVTCSPRNPAPRTGGTAGSPVAPSRVTAHALRATGQGKRGTTHGGRVRLRGRGPGRGPENARLEKSATHEAREGQRHRPQGT